MVSKLPPKLSGLLRTGAFIPVSETTENNLPDMPTPTATEPSMHSFDQSQRPVVSPEVTSQIGRDIREIDVTLIDPNPLAPREVYTSEMILTRAEELRMQGQHDPIHVIPNADVPGRFIICDGWTRVRACREHKVLDRLLSEVHHDLSLEASAWFGYEQNEGRSQHTDLDRAMFYSKLIQAGETQTEIARRAKLSKTLMSFYLSYSKLPVEVLDVIRQQTGKFSANVAYQIARSFEKSGVRRTLSLALQLSSEEHTIRWLTNQVQLVLTPPEAKQSITAKTIRYSNGLYKQRGDQFDLTITVPTDQRESFAEALEKLLSSVATQVQSNIAEVTQSN